MRITMSRTELPFLSMGSILLTGSVIRLPATERAYGIDIAALIRKTERWDQPTTTAMTRPASRGKVIADPDGIETSANSLQLNGGAIHDRAGNAAHLTHQPLAANPRHTVDTDLER